MAIRAPWKGWLRIAMPIICGLILLNTLAIHVLSVLNVASLEISYRNTSSYIQSHKVLVEVQLIFFWCTIPSALLLASLAELLCLFNDRLSPLWALISSTFAIGLWLTQVILWELCINASAPDVPVYCPSIYKGSEWAHYPSWNAVSPGGASWLVAPGILLYVIQAFLAAIVIQRTRRTSFRRSDLAKSWAQEMHESDPELRITISDEWNRELAAKALYPGGAGDEVDLRQALQAADEAGVRSSVPRGYIPVASS